jgi:hypothetical protein
MENMSDMPAGSPTQEVAAVARQSAAQVKDVVAEEAARAMDSIKSAASEQMRRGKMELTSSLRSVDIALRRTSQEMADSPLAPQMERAADAVASACDFVESHGIEDLGLAARQLSLHHPVLFYSGIFALGFAAGRFLSSTQSRPLELPEHDINLLEEELEPSLVEPAQQSLTSPTVSYHGPY